MMKNSKNFIEALTPRFWVGAVAVMCRFLNITDLLVKRMKKAKHIGKQNYEYR